MQQYLYNKLFANKNICVCMLACYSWSNGWTEWAKFSLSENKAHGCIPGV